MELAVQTMTNYPDTLALARWAEEAGAAGLAVADHYLSSPESTFALDQLTVLAAVAAQTTTLELSSLVSPVTFRHPAVMFKVGQTLDHISGGRFTLGVGAGWMAEEHERFGLSLPEMGERFDRLTEALGYLRAAIGGDESGFSGDYYRLAGGPPLKPTPVNLRLVVGGGGNRRTPDLAGTYADEFNVFPAERPYAERIERARSTAAETGRDPDSLFVSTAFPLVVGENQKDVDESIEEVARLRGTEPERIRTRWAELGIPVGTADEVKSHLEQMEKDGIRRVYFQMAFDSLDRIQHVFGLVND